MKSKVYIFVLIHFVSVLCVVGQNDSVIMLGQVEIRGEKKEIFQKRSEDNIRIIKKEEILSMPAISIQEVLSYIPGIDMRQRGVAGVQADINIRGGSSEQALVMVNGIKFTDPQTAHHLMNIPVPLSSVERIDVINGTGSGMVGQNAITGAVNIMTNLPETFCLKLHGITGDFGLLGGTIVADVPVKKVKQSVSASFNTSGGYMHNTDFSIAELFYDGGLKTGNKSELRMMGGYSDRRFGANGFYTDRFPDQWESVQTMFGAFIYKYSAKRLLLEGKGLMRENHDEFRLKRYDPQFYKNVHTSDVISIELNGEYFSRFGKTKIGTEVRKEFLESTNLGNRERLIFGILGEQHIVFLKKADAKFGSYLYYYHVGNLKLFPNVKLGYQLNKRVRIYAGMGMSNRIPTFTELYYNDPANENNPNLLPEEAVNYEGGVVYANKYYKAEASFFVRDSENLIDWIRITSDSIPNPHKWKPMNTGNVNFKGCEFSLIYYQLFQKGVFQLRNLYLGYSYIHSDVAHEDSVESKYMLSFLKQKFVGSFDMHFGEKAIATIKCRFADRQEASSYMLVDAKFSYELLKKTRLYIEVVNITNREYVEAGFVQMPGCWVRGGIMIPISVL